MSKNKNIQDSLEVIGRAKGYSHEQLTMNLPRHSNFSNVLLEQIKEIPEVILRNSGTPMAKKVNHMMREVFTEAYRAKQFIRTEINNQGVLFGVVLLKHRVIDLVLEYFHKRWPQCIVCLYNEHKHKTALIDEKGKIREFDTPLKEVVESVSINRPIIPYFDDIQFSGENIFETLYSSQFIYERKNKRYFKKMIPNKCFKLPGMRNGVEKRFQNENINKFL
ncbi:MAG: DUF4130 domain-containing protein [Candidatus Odinarchaeota archaeon]